MLKSPVRDPKLHCVIDTAYEGRDSLPAAKPFFFKLFLRCEVRLGQVHQGQDHYQLVIAAGNRLGCLGKLLVDQGLDLCHMLRGRGTFDLELSP